MKVCIAEKPSVAREIAEVLGATQRMNGYIEGNGYQVTWTFGHLCTLKEPHEYAENWKRWSLGSLPMIPPRFGIKLIENPTYEQQFKVIESLMQNAEMVINCGDAGQEGELIQRWVMQRQVVNARSTAFGSPRLRRRRSGKVSKNSKNRRNSISYMRPGYPVPSATGCWG